MFNYVFFVPTVYLPYFSQVWSSAGKKDSKEAWLFDLPTSARSRGFLKIVPHMVSWNLCSRISGPKKLEISSIFCGNQHRIFMVLHFQVLKVRGLSLSLPECLWGLGFMPKKWREDKRYNHSADPPPIQIKPLAAVRAHQSTKSPGISLILSWQVEISVITCSGCNELQDAFVLACWKWASIASGFESLLWSMSSIET